jgi:hypothetical protein
MDGELAENESIEVGGHLLSCVQCARKRALLEQTRLAFRKDAVVLPQTHYARSFAVSVALTLVVALGVMVARSPMPSPGAADVRQLLGIDCGTPGSTNCVVEQPCRDTHCSAEEMVPGLR